MSAECPKCHRMAAALVAYVDPETAPGGLPVVCDRCYLESHMGQPSWIQFTLLPDDRPMAPGYPE